MKRLNRFKIVKSGSYFLLVLGLHYIDEVDFFNHPI